MKTHDKLILKPFIYLTANSQYEFTLRACCEPSVSPLWALCELTVSYSWDQPMSSPYSGSSELTVISLLTSLWDIQWAHCEYGYSSHLHWGNNHLIITMWLSRFNCGKHGVSSEQAAFLPQSSEQSFSKPKTRKKFVQIKKVLNILYAQWYVSVRIFAQLQENEKQDTEKKGELS